MSEPKDPEKLLADALRAQAVFAPSAERIPETPAAPASADAAEKTDPAAKSSADSGTEAVPTTELASSPGELPPQYGLLSGAGADSLERERVALEHAETARLAGRPPAPPAAAPSSAPLPAYWVLLLALLLGLAAGSVIGLLTLV